MIIQNYLKMDSFNKDRQARYARMQFVMFVKNILIKTWMQTTTSAFWIFNIENINKHDVLICIQYE